MPVSSEPGALGAMRAFLERGHKGIFGMSGGGKSNAAKFFFANVPHPWVAVFVTPHDDLPRGERARTPTEVQHMIARRCKRIVWRAPKEHEVEGGRDAAVAQLQQVVSGLIATGKRLLEGGKAPVWCVLFIDEVHNFTSKTGYIGPVEEVLSEGRKYGIRAVLASQRPARVSLEVLGQARDVLVFKLNPPDQQYLERAGYPVADFEAWTADVGGKPTYRFALMQGKAFTKYECLPEV